MKATDHTIDVRGLKIHYTEWGDRRGTPLILIHGFLDHGRSWDPFVEAIGSAGGRPLWIIAPDCRGHGDSGWVGAGGYYHFPDYLFDLDTLIHSLQTPSVVLMGHSMGGTISFLYAGTFPGRVQKLILVEGLGPAGLAFTDAPPKMERWLSEVRTVNQRRPTGFSTPEEAALRLQRKNPRLDPEIALRVARLGIKKSRNGKWVWKFDPLHRTTSPQPFYPGQAAQFLSRIECPVLLVSGKESRHSLRRDLDERLQALSRRQAVEVADAGHMVHQDNPGGLANAVRGFLETDPEGQARLHRASPSRKR